MQSYRTSDTPRWRKFVYRHSRIPSPMYVRMGYDLHSYQSYDLFRHRSCFRDKLRV